MDINWEVRTQVCSFIILLLLILLCGLHLHSELFTSSTPLSALEFLSEDRDEVLSMFHFQLQIILRKEIVF